MDMTGFNRRRRRVQETVEAKLDTFSAEEGAEITPAVPKRARASKKQRNTKSDSSGA